MQPTNQQFGNPNSLSGHVRFRPESGFENSGDPPQARYRVEDDDSYTTNGTIITHRVEM